MKTYFLLLLLLWSCQPSQRKEADSSKVLKPKEVEISRAELKNPVPQFIVESGDTIYNWLDVKPSLPNLREYIQDKIKDARLGTGSVYIYILISKVGVPYNPTIWKSAGEGVDSVGPAIARKMDSFALDVASRLPNFIPGASKGKLVIVKQTLIFQFK